MKVKKQAKSFISEFKEFISQGNILDLAVGVVIGTAFRAIISSLVADIIMPLLGALFGNIDLSDLKYVITEADAVAGTAEVAIRCGMFIKYIIDFLIIAFCMFIVVKAAIGFRKKLSSLSKKDEEPATTEPVPTNDEKLLATLTEIRDIIKK